MITFDERGIVSDHRSMQYLIKVAAGLTTPNLKEIQRHQRAKLLVAKRTHDPMTYFWQLRVDAADHVLKIRKAS